MQEPCLGRPAGGRDTRALTIDTRPCLASVQVLVDVDQELLAGTFVVEGEARAVRHGDREQYPAGRHRVSHPIGTATAGPLARELQSVVQVVALIAIGLGVVFFAIALALGHQRLAPDSCSRSASPSPLSRKGCCRP